MPTPLIFQSRMDDSEYNRTLDLMVGKAKKTSRDVDSTMKGGHGGGGGRSGDFSAGLRDLSEGRTAFAVTRFTESLGLMGFALGATVAAVTVGTVAFEHYQEELAKTREESNALSASLAKLNTQTIPAGSTAERTPAPEDKTIEALKEQIKREQELQDTLYKRSHGLRGAFFAAGDVITGKAFTGNAFEDDRQMKESRKRTDVASGNIEKVERQKQRNIQFQKDASDAATSKSALQQQVEEGNRIYIDGEEKKRAFKKSSRDNDLKLDEGNAKSQKEQLQQQVEEGNRIYMDGIEKRKQLQKELTGAKMNKYERAAYNVSQTQSALGIATGNYESAASKKSAFDHMSQNERRQYIRDQRRDERINLRRARIDSNPNVRGARSGDARLDREKKTAITNVQELAAALARALTPLIAAP